MIPKQREMDGIVQQIYYAMEDKDHLKSTLLVLCGDHGMNDGGNHGGSSPGETSTALVFASPKFKDFYRGVESPTKPHQDLEFYNTIEQSNIAPTMAGLLGFPTPLNNLGVFIPELLQFWSKSDDRIQLLLRNALQIQAIVKATFPNPAYDNPFATIDCKDPSSSGDELACKWRRVTDIYRSMGGFNPPEEVVKQPLLDFCHRAQEVMSSTASNYDITRLISGIVLAGVSVLLTLSAMGKAWPKPMSTTVFYGFLLLLYGVMMFASSYVEEEQHFWYWSTSAWLFYIAFSKPTTTTTTITATGTKNSATSIRARLLIASILLALLRITLRWNQTGQKYAGAPDIVHSALFTQTPIVLWILIAATYFVAAEDFRGVLQKQTQKLGGATGSGVGLDQMTLPMAYTVGLMALLFKLAFTVRDAPELVPHIAGRWQESMMTFLLNLPLVPLARAVFVSIAGGLAFMVVQDLLLPKEAKKAAKEVKARKCSI